MAVVRTTSTARQRMRSSAAALASGWSERGFVSMILLAVVVLTSIPYVYARVATPPGLHFMGIAFNVPDHAQYFSWMRDFTFRNLAADRLTSEPNEPAFFNLLWWSMGRLEAWTGLSQATLFSGLRLFAVVSCLLSVYGFLRLVISDTLQRRVALVMFAFCGGLGIVWVIAKYLFDQSELMFPLDTQAAEPNSFLMMLGFPHFTLALGLLVATFGLQLVAQRHHHLGWAIGAGAVALVLGLQHTYDLITIYAVLGLVGALTWLRDRRFPGFQFVCGLIIVGLSAPPAAYSLWLVQSNDVWGKVLSQFDNAGVFTPNPLHLPILLGIPFLLALLAFRPRMLLSRSDGELLVAAWFVAHFALIYLPVNFQIHLLLGWQIPITVLASSALVNRVGPALQTRSRFRSETVVVAVVVLALLTNVYLLSWRVIELRRHEEPYFLTSDDVAALNWLDEHATTNDVVLTDLALGQYVPSSSDARTFLGHWANTLDYEDKRAMVAAVLSGMQPSIERQRMLDTYGVSYVIDRTGSNRLEVTGPTSQMRLVPVYRHGTVTIYRVESET